jgi:hypothetical protein
VEKSKILSVFVYRRHFHRRLQEHQAGKKIEMFLYGLTDDMNPNNNPNNPNNNARY